MLFEPGRHEPLLDAAWDASRAHDAIRVMVDAMQENFRSDIGWPAHPLDEVEEPRTGLKTLYFGAAGTLWSMWYLEREGAVELRIKPSGLIGRLDETYRTEPDTGEVVPSYFLGEVGILLAIWRLTGSTGAADRLWASVRENIPNPTNEALWAAPGTMVAAWHMFKWTGRRALSQGSRTFRAQRRRKWKTC